jgi:hypothetical protein
MHEPGCEGILHTFSARLWPMATSSCPVPVVVCVNAAVQAVAEPWVSELQSHLWAMYVPLLSCVCHRCGAG